MLLPFAAIIPCVGLVIRFKIKVLYRINLEDLAPMAAPVYQRAIGLVV